MTPPETLSIPGSTRFREVHETMLDLLQKRIEDRIPDTLIFCEHTPVITRGRGLQRNPGRSVRAMPLNGVPEGTDLVEIERGGDLTWHGPGQLVVYPVVKLGGDGLLGGFLGQDIDRYIRFLERVWIGALAGFQVECTTKPGASGVWIGERKLASVGIALRRWVTYHGVAMNIINDLKPYQVFSPCGFQSEVMTRLSDLPGIPREGVGADWRSFWETRFLSSLNHLLLSKF